MRNLPFTYTPDNPAALALLPPISEKREVGEDSKREATIDDISRQALDSLVRHIESANDSDLFAWLAGQRRSIPEPPHDYDALTCLTMAS